MTTPPGPPPYDPAPFKELMSVFASALDKLDTHTSARLNRMEIALGSMAKVASEALQVASATRQEAKETKEGLERLHAVFVNATKCSIASTEKIGRLLGVADEQPQGEGQQPTTVMGRIKQLEQAVLELSESVSDPDAARPVIVRHEASVNTSPDLRPLVDSGVDAPPLEPAHRVETGIQVDPPLTVSGLLDQFDRWQSDLGVGLEPRWNRTQGHAGPSSPSPFGMQPLGPAQWTPQRDYSDASSSSAANSSKLPSPVTVSQPLQPSGPTTAAAVRAPAAASAPSAQQEGRASSILDEQEIQELIDMSMRTDVENTSQTASSPAPTTSVRAEEATPPTPHAPLPLPKAIPPIPRRTAMSQAASPPGPAAEAAGAVSSSAGVPRTGQAQSAIPQKTTPPLPRRTVVASAVAGTSSAASSAKTASTSAPAPPTKTSPHKPTARITLPLPRGFGKANRNGTLTTPSVSSSASLSSLSSTSGSQQQQPSPPRAAPSPSHSDSLSLSSLSSLSTLAQSQPQSQAQTPTASGVRTRTSARLQTSVTATAESTAEPASTASREGSTRGRSRSATRGGRAGAASASARVPVKTERGEPESSVRGRPGKRRKTMGDASEVQRAETSVRGGRGGSRGRGASRGRGGGRGGSRGAGAGGPRKQPVSEQTGAGPSGNNAAAAGTASNAGDKGKGKAKYEPPRIGTDCLWPEKIEGDEAYQREVRGFAPTIAPEPASAPVSVSADLGEDAWARVKVKAKREIDDVGRQFVQCDNCEGWYHFGCVGLAMDDPRLDPDADFICPPCETSEAIREQRQGLRFQAAACARPDCERAGLAEDTNEYFVERIIGRRPYDSDRAAGIKRPNRFLWLVKWDGWKADFASWTEREHLGDCARLIEDFEQAAEIEGRNLDKLDEIIVLNEAAAAGW
ncbi:hypothetical protein OH77DRAFT_1525484 [Trametes cingulata]|nr:hypothetical protein OH77DRAFT_1525484 [Trametes cingulata]